MRQTYAETSLLVTSDYVLDETITRLFAGTSFSLAETFFNAIFQAEKLGILLLEHITPDHFKKAYGLRIRFRDKPRISFTDLTSFVVMEELGIRNVPTADAHFRQVLQEQLLQPIQSCRSTLEFVESAKRSAGRINRTFVPWGRCKAHRG